MSCRSEFVIVALAALLVAFLAASPAKAQSAGGSPDGIWLTQAGDAKVHVSKCGSGICGVVVWLKEPIDPLIGKPQVDDKNPNPALAKRPIIGISLFLGMRPAAPNQWSGQIYNADDGKTYASKISVTGPATLKVEGCVGALCGGEDWSRSSR
jgi:uncharacterized protein (DUF2147 family)